MKIKDNKPRCEWVNLNNPLYVKAHDEFGDLEFRDNKLFEKLCLETLQPGLSFLIVYTKLKYFRKYFHNFIIQKVARMDYKTTNIMMKDYNLIRNEKKLHAIINNARVVTQIQKEWGSFAKYIWSFEDYRIIFYSYKNYMDIPGSSSTSEKLAENLRRRGATYVGPVNMEAYLQYIGVHQIHSVNCFRHRELKKKWSKYAYDVRPFLK